MNTADKVIDFLNKEFGITDIFGIPGGVVLPLLDGVAKNKNVESHLSTNEQHSILSALGYARVSGNLGVVYATKGPGFTNLISGIAFAYQDSFPLLAITAHDEPAPTDTRHNGLQNIDTVNLVKTITKQAIVVNDQENLFEFFEMCHLANSGRKGPVMADFSTKFLGEICE